MQTIYFATNRNPNRTTNPTNFGKGFHKDALANLRFGKAEVNGKKIKITVADEVLKKDADRKQKDGKGSKLGSQSIFTDIRREMANHSPDTIVFVHGYNVSFKEALKAAAHIQRNFEKLNGTGVNVVLFSWPSDGSMMPYIAYANDRQDAKASGPAFARGFLKLADFLRGATPQESCNQKIHLIAHSMGNYVLRNALQEIIRQSPGRAPRLFDQIFLMAADEDDDAFEYDHKFKQLPSVAKRVNVYFNNGDTGMAISDKTKGNPDRLGDDGPRLPRSVPGKVSLVDCSDIVDGIVEHSYYLKNAVVVDDMMAVLEGVRSKDIPRRDYEQENNRYRL